MGRPEAADAKAAPAVQPDQPGTSDEGQHSSLALPHPPPSGREDPAPADGSEAPAVDPPPMPDTATVPPPPPPPPEPVANPPPPPQSAPPPVPAPSPPARRQATPKHAKRGLNSPYSVGKPWSSGLYDFDGNKNNALMTAFFPCVTFGQIAEILDDGKTSCTLGSIMFLLMPVLSCSIMGSIYRKRLRLKYNLVQAPAEDWILHLFCPCCALCQEYRELQSRGVDPSLGWLGNLAKQQEMTSPPVVQSMDK